MAAPYFGNSTLRFQVVFNLDTGYFNITDPLSSSYNSTWGFTYANWKEIFKISFAGSGISSTVVYQNAGWVAGSFAAPDLNGTTPTTTFSGALIPVDADGLPLKGTYTFESKVTFDNGTTVYTTSNTYVYGFVSPEVTISDTVDCSASTLLAVDETEYVVEGVTPTIAGNFTITKPTGSGANAPGTTTFTAIGTQRLIGGGVTSQTILWSKIWQISIESSLTYQMQVWGVYPFIIIYDVITGYKSVDVECTSNCCNVRQCVLNLTELWKSYKGVDPVSYDRIGRKLMEINVEWMNLEFAQGCGDAYDAFCANLVDICKSENCSTPPANQSSQEIWPIRSTTVASPSTFSFTTSNVTFIGTSTGTAGDLHWYTDNSTYLYLQQNIAGTWTAVSGNLYVTSTATPTPANVIVNDTPHVGTDAGTSEKDLDTYTFTPNDYADTNGDIIHMYAMFQLLENDNGKTMKLYFGGDVIVQKFTDALINSTNNMVVMEAWITRTGSASQDIVARCQSYNEIVNTFANKTKAWTSDQIFKITGQSAVGTVDDVVALKFVIDIVKVIPPLP